MSIAYEVEQVQPPSMYERLVLDQEALIDDLRAENTSQREEISDLGAENTNLREELDEERRRRILAEETNERGRAFIHWTSALFANKTIPEACKLVFWQFYLAFFLMRPQTTGERMRIGVEETAEALGISVKTVRTATDKGEMWDVLTRDYEKYKTDAGDERTLVYITLDDVVQHPENIQMEKRHGGIRKKTCPTCGTENVDRYTVQYCRHCDANAWYGQPGLRADADVILAQRASHTPLYRSGKNQDAFGAVAPESPEIDALSARIETALVQTSTVQRARPHTQDAFIDQAVEIAPPPARPSPSPDSQLEAQHPSSTSAASCPERTIEQQVIVCRSRMWLGKDGQPAHALEKVTGYQECGSTVWQWSADDQRRVCAKCWTPEPHSME